MDSALAWYAQTINNGAGLVWVSEKPWAEIVLARRGAAHVLTVEYGHVATTHPTIAATTLQLFAAFMAQSPHQFDFAFTFSSLEHSASVRLDLISAGKFHRWVNSKTLTSNNGKTVDTNDSKAVTSTHTLSHGCTLWTLLAFNGLVTIEEDHVPSTPSLSGSPP